MCEQVLDGHSALGVLQRLPHRKDLIVGHLSIRHAQHRPHDEQHVEFGNDTCPRQPPMLEGVVEALRRVPSQCLADQQPLLRRQDLQNRRRTAIRRNRRPKLRNEETKGLGASPAAAATPESRCFPPLGAARRRPRHRKGSDSPVGCSMPEGVLLHERRQLRDWDAHGPVRVQGLPESLHIFTGKHLARQLQARRALPNGGNEAVERHLDRALGLVGAAYQQGPPSALAAGCPRHRRRQCVL
mmetsp:Transcript_29537/g.84951  ORF Transcript_29537/g.84951 Transcript_29537/m.84951 type:complete len:242 (-) Transcript_29537:2901-3626(-)